MMHEFSGQPQNVCSFSVDILPIPCLGFGLEKNGIEQNVREKR